MFELAIVVLSVLAVAGVLALAAARLAPFLRWIEVGLTFLSSAIILFVMFFVCAEVLMRYGFNSPIPGHLEGSELLLPMIVFFAISYTQSQYGHVGMTLVVDALPDRSRRSLVIATSVLTMLICAVLAYFGTKYAFQLWDYDDVTMTPPYIPTWPSAAAIALGYFLVSLRIWFQALHVVNPERFPDAPRDEGGLPAAD